MGSPHRFLGQTTSIMPIQPPPKHLTDPTTLLDFGAPSIARLIASRGWRELSEYERIGAIYDFVRDEIAFGYNSSEDLPASVVLADGIGQCNTKSTLLRAIGVPCRFHGFTIDKALQRGAVTGLWYRLAPRNILHSWVEVFHDGRWINLEGFILDTAYLSALQRRYADRTGPFCGFGVATPDLRDPPVACSGGDTYIQREGINHDFGLFDSPDDFYDRIGVNLSGLRKWLYARFVRHSMNRNVGRIREQNGRGTGAGRRNATAPGAPRQLPGTDDRDGFAQAPVDLR